MSSSARLIVLALRAADEFERAGNSFEHTARVLDDLRAHIDDTTFADAVSSLKEPQDTPETQMMMLGALEALRAAALPPD